MERHGIDERAAFELLRGHARRTNQKIVEVDARYFRPAEVDVLLGDSSKARRELGWEPTVGFERLVDMMVDADLERARSEAATRVVTRD